MTCSTRGCIDGKILGLFETYDCPECSKSIDVKDVFKARSVELRTFRQSPVALNLDILKSMKPWTLAQSQMSTAVWLSDYQFDAIDAQAQLTIYCTPLTYTEIIELLEKP